MVNRNGSNNGVHKDTAIVARNGNGAHNDPAIIDGHERCSGTGCRPQSPTPWGSPSTPRWSPSARGTEAGSSTTSKATPSLTRPTASSATAGGAMSWLEM